MNETDSTVCAFQAPGRARRELCSAGPFSFPGASSAVRAAAGAGACVLLVAAACAGVRSGATGAAAVPAAAERPIHAGSMTIDRAAREVTVDAEVACNRGWVEQAVCRAGTREHESLLVIAVPPSRVHAGLLLIGLNPGTPGKWEAGPDGTAVVRVPPEGDAVEAWVDVAGARTPLSSWIADPVRGRAFPAHPWVFAGSRMRTRPPERGGGEQFVADATGSVVGIVTFGDEVIACREVISDKVDTDAPQWQAATDRMPEPGTPVKLVLRPAAPARAAP